MFVRLTYHINEGRLRVLSDFCLVSLQFCKYKHDKCNFAVYSRATFIHILTAFCLLCCALSRTHIAVNAPDESRSEKTPSPSVFSGTGVGTGVSSNVSKAQQEPSVDFELDIKVDIDSGKCVLHPKDPKPDAEDTSKR